MKLATVALLLPLLLLRSAVGPAQEQPRAPQLAPYTYQGTVQAVQLRPGSLDLITGVGLALRVVHMQVMPATEIVSGAASVALGDLKPGDIVRAECHPTDKGLVAHKIERLPQTTGPEGWAP